MNKLKQKLARPSFKAGVRRAKRRLNRAEKRSAAIREFVKKIADWDFENGDALCLKLGGDGDSGEILIEAIEAVGLPRRTW